MRRNKKYKWNGYVRPPKCEKNEINNNKKKWVVALVVEFWFAHKSIVVKPDALNFVDIAVENCWHCLWLKMFLTDGVNHTQDTFHIHQVNMLKTPGQSWTVSIVGWWGFFFKSSRHSTGGMNEDGKTSAWCALRHSHAAVPAPTVALKLHWWQSHSWWVSMPTHISPYLVWESLQWTRGDKGEVWIWANIGRFKATREKKKKKE